MKKTLIKYLVLAFSVIVVFGSCRKDDYEGTQTEGNGKSFVRIADSKLKANFFDAFTDKKTTSLFSIKKDAANNAELNKATTVTLTSLGQTYLNKYNAEHGTTLEIMPTSVYTLTGNAAATSGGATLTFPSGSFQEKFMVILDGAKLDPAKKYALAYVISDAQGLTTKVGRDTIITTVGVKNQYDGVYNATGKFVRVGLDERVIDQHKALVTVDATTVQSTVADLGDAYPLLLKVNADNSVTIIWPAATQALLPAAYTQVGVNKYDPATKTYTLHYQYRDGARTTEEVLTYDSSR